MDTTTPSQTESTLKNYITKTYLYDQPGFVLTSHYLLFEEGVIDSMGIFRLITFMTETFNITISHEEIILENFGTVADMTALVDSHLQSVQDAPN